MVIHLYWGHGKKSHGLWGWCLNVSPFCLLLYSPPDTSGLCYPAQSTCHYRKLTVPTFVWIEWLDDWRCTGCGSGGGLYPWNSFLWSHCSHFILLTGGIILKNNSYRMKCVYRKWVFDTWMFSKSATQNSDTDGHPELFFFHPFLTIWTLLTLCYIVMSHMPSIAAHSVGLAFLLWRFTFWVST
jgi:hypothetical protein